ncbi:glycoside hydrolase family 16 protein [Punctularia strigosozonata HHB-11173 SS5]|uniref:glycoside hydrolase family 16 protein n=1 Tax=Punctularia strigosozonata (strain HHB-11173) TaxID=741275 RepID=UPI00044180D1|nr:glycoside hydrolase family 16 protein [Punctularia strigosozonata HHB-11173 SS5]EIN12303.1 glycoside hydrolase family 16 protein [Punctularia strigosozonata HHB-11173 SS5]
MLASTSRIVAAAAGVLALADATTAQYQMVKQYQGENFFDDWVFYNKIDDLTHGYVKYVSAKDGLKDRLAIVNDAGNAIMRVDNSTEVKFNGNRNSVRITSKDRYTVGSLWIVDMLHAPYGCSVWPGFWSTAPSWPSGGEIDTFEGVNGMVQNQMSLHTNPGCTQVNPVQTSTLINSTDCDHLANANSGCTVTDPSVASYGPGFAQAGGGVYVTEYAEEGISIWFFNRSSIPDAIKSNASTIDASSLGTPVANWPTGGCDMSTFFAAQELVFDITLCGDYAGQTSTFAQTCSGECYQDWVLGPPSNYDTAYFEVQWLRVFGTTRNTVVQGSGAAPATAGTWLAPLLVGVVAALLW